MEPQQEDEATVSPSAEGSGTTPELTALMQMFLQDRQRLQFVEQELADERRRREREMEDHVERMQEQLSTLEMRGTGYEGAGRGGDSVKLAKLTDTDNIETYLTTFEHLMRAYDVAEARWVLKLAPQLSGKVQQATQPWTPLTLPSTRRLKQPSSAATRSTRSRIGNAFGQPSVRWGRCRPSS